MFLLEFCLCTEFTFSYFYFFLGHLGCHTHFPKMDSTTSERVQFCLGVIQTSHALNLHGKPSQPLGNSGGSVHWSTHGEFCRGGEFSHFVKHIRFGACWCESWCMLELFFFPLYLFYLSSLTVSINLVMPSCPNCSLCSFYLRRISDLNQSQMALALSSGLLWRILELHLPHDFGCFVDPRDSLQRGCA